MKYLLSVIFVTACFAACDSTEKKAANPIPEAVSAAPSKNSAAFNASFEKLLAGYYSLKDAMVEVDTVKANVAARSLAVFADSLKITELKNDSAGGSRDNAKNFAGTVTGSALGLAGETDYAKKKKEFQMISDAMYDLVRTVKYDKEKIYHQHCPMAINDTEEAYWLSNSNTIVNPYLGKKHPKYRDSMIECGDVTDSLDYSK